MCRHTSCDICTVGPPYPQERQPLVACCNAPGDRTTATAEVARAYVQLARTGTLYEGLCASVFDMTYPAEGSCLVLCDTKKKLILCYHFHSPSLDTSASVTQQHKNQPGASAARNISREAAAVRRRSRSTRGRARAPGDGPAR